jgi:hypothetical protein
MKIRVGKSDFGLTIDFLFYLETNGYPSHVAKPVELEFVPMEEGKISQPTVSINSLEGQQLLKSLIEELENQGIRADKEAKNEGELIASKYHLEDLRKLLKITK